MASTILVDKIDPQSGTALEIGSSGDTITIPSGATFTNSGTATGFATHVKLFSDTSVSGTSLSIGSCLLYTSPSPRD